MQTAAKMFDSLTILAFVVILSTIISGLSVAFYETVMLLTNQ